MRKAKDLLELHPLAGIQPDVHTHTYIYISLAGERTAAERLWKQNFATARRKQWEILGVGISPNPKRGAGNDDSSEDFRGWEVLNFVLQSDETRSSDIDPNSQRDAHGETRQKATAKISALASKP